MMPLNHDFFMRQALREAHAAYEAEEVPIGCVIVINNKIIARAHNQVELLKDPTAHAEILAITAACNYLGAKYLPSASIYITLEPCLMCSGALYWTKLEKIIYGAPDVKNGFSKYVHTGKSQKHAMPFPFHPKTQLLNGVLEDECLQLMKDFFKARR